MIIGGVVLRWCTRHQYFDEPGIYNGWRASSKAPFRSDDGSRWIRNKYHQAGIIVTPDKLTVLG